MIESAESSILFWSNTKFGRTGKVAKIQPFNLDGQRGKTRSHYLLVRGSEIDVRMEIIPVLLYNNTIQPTRPTDHGESVMKSQKVSADDDFDLLTCEGCSHTILSIRR